MGENRPLPFVSWQVDCGACAGITCVMLHRGFTTWSFIYRNIGNTHELANIGTLAFGAYNGVHLIFVHNEELKDIVTIQTSEFMNRHVISPPLRKSFESIFTKGN